MNPLSYFSQLESDRARGDKFEGTDNIIQPKHIGEFTVVHQKDYPAATASSRARVSG